MVREAAVCLLKKPDSGRKANEAAMIAYGYNRQVSTPFENVVEAVAARLKDRGSGVWEHRPGCQTNDGCAGGR